MNINMPYSPLDALINALPEVRKAGKVKKGDTVISVHQRIADVYLPIVKRIQEEAVKAYKVSKAVYWTCNHLDHKHDTEASALSCMAYD